MKLYHEKLLPYLNDKRVELQHKFCCDLRAGIAPINKTNKYIDENSYLCIYEFHKLVMQEMEKRKIKYDKAWTVITFRGIAGMATHRFIISKPIIKHDGDTIYKEHDDKYLKECIKSLAYATNKLIIDYKPL